MGESRTSRRLLVLAPRRGPLAVTGYGGSWLALRLVPGAAEALRKTAWGQGMSSASPGSDGIFGDTPAGMLASAPHSEATLSIVAATGVAILVITPCLAAMDAFPRLRRLAAPVIAVGSMSLTAYLYHIVAIWLLEWLMGRATGIARRIRRDESAADIHDRVCALQLRHTVGSEDHRCLVEVAGEFPIDGALQLVKRYSASSRSDLKPSAEEAAVCTMMITRWE